MLFQALLNISMQYHHDFPLNNIDRLVKFVDEYSRQFDGEKLYMFPLTRVVPRDILEEVNAGLVAQGLPKVFNLLGFKRKNLEFEGIHRDSSEEELIHCSVVIPVNGCEGSCMFWMDGDFREELEYKHNVPYKIVKWNSMPTAFHKHEIVQPTLCKVDIPHSARGNPNGGYRTIISLRFMGNPTMEQVLAMRQNHQA